MEDKKFDVVFADTFFDSFKKMINRKRWYWKLYDIFRYDVGWFIRNLIFFRRELWKFRPYDFSHNLSLLGKSLEATEKCVRNGISAEGEKTADEIKEVIQLIKNVCEDNFTEQAEKILNIDLSKKVFNLIETDKGVQL